MDHITTMLKEHKSVDGISLFQHLTALLHKILNESNKYSDNMEFFELLSDFVKKNSFKYKNPRSDDQVNNIPTTVGDHEQWIEKCLKLLKEYKSINSIQEMRFPNFVVDSKMIENVGIYFGEEESYRIAMSLKKLAAFSQAKELRFWGKILCSGQDYYVAEGIRSAESQLYADEVPVNCEKQGTGANSYSHWVCHDVLGEWFELPYVSPSQISATQSIKYIFTGNLNNTIASYPPFDGKEKHFLKAQLTRISHACTLVPKQLYKPHDEFPEQIVFEEEPFKLQEYAELKTVGNWLHLHPALLKMGRCSHYVSKDLSQEEQDAEKARLEEQDPVIERLKPLEEEKGPFPPENPDDPDVNWNVKEYGDLQNFAVVGGEGTACYGTISIKNSTWPGAQLVCNLKGWANVYVGYGLKANQKLLQPLQPDDIGEDQDDVKDEEDEPNPKKPIENIEKDSDKGDKEAEEEDM